MILSTDNYTQFNNWINVCINIETKYNKIKINFVTYINVVRSAVCSFDKMYDAGFLSGSEGFF